MSNSGTEVVITGIGVMSPIGIGTDAFWQSLSDGRCGFRRTELTDFTAAPGCIGGEISDFTDSTAKKNYLKAVRKQIKVMCREIQLGVASALQAMEHAQLDAASLDPERIGVEFGASLMSSPPEVLAEAAAACHGNGKDFIYEKWGLNPDGRFQGMEPLWLLKYLPNMPGCHIGIAIDARGPNNSHTMDEASSGVVLSEAAGILKRGRADVMIVGTTGTHIHPVKAGQHRNWDVLADGPADERCRPLDKARSGEVLAEAACSFILESRAHAEARGAKILGTILGNGSSCVVGSEKQAVEQAAVAALRQAEIDVADLGHINVSATGHPERDTYEAAAICEVLKTGRADTPITAIKSYIGSSGSGAGLVEIAASVLGLQHGVVPRTLNFQESDADTPLNVVHGDHLATDNQVFLKTSVTRMGQATAAVIRV